MQENMGRKEQVVRAMAGPALITAALTSLGARQGRPAGLGVLVWGALVTETAISRTCSSKALLKKHRG